MRFPIIICRLSILAGIFLISQKSVLAQASLPQASHSVSELYQFCIEFQEDYGSLRRFYTISNSPERRERFSRFFQNQSQKLDALDFDQLSVGGQVDYLLSKNFIQNQLDILAQEANEYNQLSDWVSWGAPIYALEKRRRRGKKLDGAQVAQDMTQVGKSIVDKIKALVSENALFPQNLSRRARGIMEGYKQALRSVYLFYQGYDPEFNWWVEKPYHHLDSLLKLYSEKIQARVDTASLPPQDASGIVGKPIGELELRRLLKQEMIPYSPKELIDIANKEFAWCDAELLKASEAMGFGKDWKAAQEKVKQSYVKPGEQPEAMLDLYNQSLAFLKKHDLLSIPPISEETWRMTMIPPERQRISPFFLGGEVLQISYPTDDMSHEEKLMSMRGNNPHFSRSTVHHELIAGHHLQGFMNRRNKSYRFFYTPFWTEGWALYWELLLWDMDFPRSPEDRIGMLFWRMHRCARIIFSLNYHLGKWSPQECIDFLVDRVGHERANAEGEVRRSFTGNYGPLYQIAYMLGGLQFYALKEELVESKQMTYKEFHDAVLRENNMPVEMLRAILMNKKLKKNFKTHWRFYK